MDEARRVLVTGGASGLGAAVVTRCRARGDDVVVLDRAVPESQRKPSPGNLSTPVPCDRAIRVDLADLDAADAAVREGTRRLGGLDGVVLAAGMNAPGPTHATPPATLAAIVQVNAVAALVTARAALPALAERGGRLVFVGSTLARRGSVGYAAYAASKHAVDGMARSLALEYRGRVAVSVVHPGAMDTPMLHGRPEGWAPPDDTRMDPGAAAEAVQFVLDQPIGVVVHELVITSTSVGDWLC